MNNAERFSAHKARKEAQGLQRVTLWVPAGKRKEAQQLIDQQLSKGSTK